MAGVIAGELRELKAVKAELKRISKEVISPLKIRAKELEERIIRYLRKTNQDGVMCGEMVVLRDAKEYRKRKKKVESERDGLNVMRSYGIGRNQREAKQILDDIVEATRGNKTPTEKLVIDRIH